MEKLELTLLEINQILENEQLEIFQKRGTKAAITDFAITLGGFVSDCYIGEGNNTLEDRAGHYWTKTAEGSSEAYIVGSYGIDYNDSINRRRVGIRPTLPFANISSSSFNQRRGKNNLLEVEYGYYPQQAVSQELQSVLESIYINGTLKKTGKFYTTDSRKYDEYDKDFQAQTHWEYEYGDKRYVRVNINSCFCRKNFQLSNGVFYKDGDCVWIEVQPVKWLVDEKQDLAICEKIIFAGVQFHNILNYKGNFEVTSMKKFLDESFSKDLQNNMTNINNLENMQSHSIHLVSETRNPMIIDAKIEYKKGTNVMIGLPETIFQSLQNSDSVTLYSAQNPEKQLVYSIYKK